MAADLLADTPYLLDESSGPQAMEQARKLHEEVSLLRIRGELDPATLESLQREWRLKQVYESAGIEGNSLTMTETRMAIQRGVTISGKPPVHSEEVRHLNTALVYLETLARSNEALTEWEIREIQKLIVGPEDRNGGS
jgi:Fic family protein